MSEQAGYSPNFKRPAEIMRMRRKKRARSECRAGGSDLPGEGDSSPACIRPFSPGPLLQLRLSSGSGRGIRGRNPFANVGNTLSKDPEDSTTKRGEESTYTPIPGVPEPVPGVLEAQSPEEPSRKKRLTFPESEDITASLLMTRIESATPPSEAPPTSKEYPADWSLKTRVLFTSPVSLSWAEGPRAQEEATGLSQHCRAQFNTLPPTRCLMEDPRWCSQLRCSFQQSLVYWQHPSLPWLRLFPRINAERSFSGQSAPWSQDAVLQHSLMREWSVSLSSLYSLLKARLCPYFYLCSYQFTVLFRAAGLAASNSITAIIAPTTRGFREAMKAEGIEFSLPFAEDRKNSRQQKDKDEEEENLKQKGDEGEDDDDEDEDGSFSWLKEMGVQDKIKKVDGVLQQLQRESQTVSLDHRPESAVYVEATHTFTLINFLINSKSVVAATGSQAGLPPTLLAPSAFRGATMHTLKARSVNVKTQVGSTFQNISSLELTGPVLPSSLHAIASLLQSAQKGNFAATLYTHTPTAVLNLQPSNQQECVGGSVDLSACGLPPSSIQQLQKPSVLGKTSLTSLKMNNHSYTWNN